MAKDDAISPMTAPKGGLDILTLGFGVTVAMWLAGYLCRLPAVMLPSPLVFIAMMICLFGGSIVAGAFSPRGVKGGLLSSLLVALLNLLILGSLITGDQPNQIKPAVMLWLPGWFVLAGAIGLIGASIGARLKKPAVQPEWLGWFVLVDAAATFLLIAVGGLVTSNDAGLAVVDWPNSFGYNMFLYPLSRMTGGIYYEHAHRLFGSLVGITTLVMTILVFRHDTRKPVKIFSLFLLAFVSVQGILGGLRVTGYFTFSTSVDEVAPNLTLAVVHGVAGQAFLGLLALLAALTSRDWKNGRAIAAPSQRIKLDRQLSIGFAIAVLMQIFLGALQRHFSIALTYHITGAVVISLYGILVGIRAIGLHPGQKNVANCGMSLMIVVIAQIVLGFAALVATLLHKPGDPYTPLETLIPTVHQAAGAVLMALSMALCAWHYRDASPTSEPVEA